MVVCDCIAHPADLMPLDCENAGVVEVIDTTRHVEIGKPSSDIFPKSADPQVSEAVI